MSVDQEVAKLEVQVVHINDRLREATNLIKSAAELTMNPDLQRACKEFLEHERKHMLAIRRPRRSVKETNNAEEIVDAVDLCCVVQTPETAYHKRVL